ncbi:hypothetical protein LguiA_007585 [Lonicera macranthoides]
MDFESESQKECQDILDCVEDSPNFESLKGSSEKMVPIVDGSSNDQSLIPLAAKSSEKKLNCDSEKSLHAFVNRDIGSSSNSKHKRKSPLWGSIPFSLTLKLNDDLQPTSTNLTDRYGNDTKDGKRNYFSREASTVVGCSVRDLMRRKRSHRVEPPEDETPHVEKVSSQGESQKDAFLCTKERAGGQGVTDISSSHSMPSSAELTEFHEKRLCAETSAVEVCSEGHPNRPFMYGKLPLSSGSNDGNFRSSEGLDVVVTGATREENFDGLVVTTSTNFVRADNLGSEHQGRDTDVSQPGTSVSVALNMEANPVGLSRMNFGNKQSVIKRTKGISGNALLSFDSSDCPCPADEEKYEQNYEQTSVPDCVVDKCLDRREEVQHVKQTSDLSFHEEGVMGISTSYPNNGSDLYMLAPVFSPPLTDSVHKWLLNDGTVQDGVVDECLPFFEGDYQERNEVENVRYRSTDLNYCRQVIMGVPTHYQNDGSYLYMLTPAFSPPSADKVHKWLLSDGSGPSGDLVESDDSLANDCDEPVPEPESGSISNAKPSLDKVNKKFQGSNDAQKQPLHNEVTTTVLQREGNILKVKQGSGCSQDISQISGPDGKSKLTPLSQIGFRDPASVGGGQQLTLLSIEVQAESRGDLRSDPRFDAINLIVLVVQEDDDHIRDAHVLVRSDTEGVQRNIDGTTGCKFLVSSEEKHLFNHFIKIISSYDPDILIGWDIQGGSLGFLAERAAYFGIGLLNKISRTPSQSIVTAIDSNIQDKGIVKNDLLETLMADSVLIEDAIIEDEWGRTHASGVHVGGRVVLNVWRLMRGEVKLNMYTAEAVAEAVLRRKIPFIHYKVLTNWFSSGPGRARHRCIEYILERAKLNLQLVNQLDMINRTSELARVFGIDFFSVLSRGSQYRVESMLLRLAHTQNYLAISPGAQQVASQPAMECLPLVMEPESGFYADPVVVLDFQSLYPSMIIAYNLCFSTCLGKITHSNSNILGVSSYSPDRNVLRNLKRKILLTPNGVMYVPSKVRKGVLPRLLDEILSTRIMVKKAMKKLAPPQKVLNRIFNARQLALKLIANVTYGYTAAGFSGRMPCAELADSIVQCGRRTLETAISLVNTHDKWKAKVIYGDTDSMFVLLRGRSVKEAFKIGYEIASAVSAMNPSPVTLKMEKVYHPCFLLTKKRYVGYSYESPDQLKPSFDAKGIETIRRDTCAAVSKTMEQSLRLFFEHQDISKVRRGTYWNLWKAIAQGIENFRKNIRYRVGNGSKVSFWSDLWLGDETMQARFPALFRITCVSKVKWQIIEIGSQIQVKSYLVRQWTRILSGRVSLQDFIFAKEVRLGTYSTRTSSLPPAAIVATKAMRSDPRAEPRYGDRIPYVVVHGEPGARLVDMVVDPLDLVAIDSPFRLNDLYYINKQIIPALQRAFGLVGADLSQWFLDMPRPAQESVGKRNFFAQNHHPHRTRIDYYYLSKNCVVCGELVQASAHLCDKCSKDNAGAATAVIGRTSKLEREIQHLVASDNK